MMFTRSEPLVELLEKLTASSEKLFGAKYCTDDILDFFLPSGK